MSIREIGEKIKGLALEPLKRVRETGAPLWVEAKEQEKDLWTLLVVVLVAGLFFGLGRVSTLETTGQQPIKITQPASVTTALEIEKEKTINREQQGVTSQSRYVASKSGIKYHLPSCSGAKRIKEENKIWFATAEEARAAGYTPAANCPGI